MKNAIKTIIGVIVILALAAGPAFAEGMGGCAAGHAKGCFKEKKEAVFKELNLTPEQDKLLKEAKAAHRTEMEELGKALKAKRDALQNALSAPGVTRKQVEPIASEIKSLEAQMVDRRIDGILKIKEILTPEQYQKLQGMKEGWRKDGHNRRFGKR